LRPIRGTISRIARHHEKTKELDWSFQNFDLKRKKNPRIKNPRSIQEPPVHRITSLTVSLRSKKISVLVYSKKYVGNNNNKIATGVAQARMSLINFPKFLVKNPVSTKHIDKMKYVSNCVPAITSRMRMMDKNLLLSNDVLSLGFSISRNTIKLRERAIRFL